jgi:hypothetical protein
MFATRTPRAVRASRFQRSDWVVVLVLLAAAPVLAATPPALVNYQGVLRDNNDKPLNGPYDMLFRFMDAATAGNEIMNDQHAAATSNGITVTGGLFNVPLGSGTIADGSGPGTYTTLDAVFRDYGSVWLEVRVGAETLTPRTRIQSAAYALNATNAVSATNATNATNAANATNATELNGQPGSFYLDTSGTRQAKYGTLHLQANDPALSTLEVIAASPSPYAIYAGSDGGPSCTLAERDGGIAGGTGIDCGAVSMGAYIHNTGYYSYALIPKDGNGIVALGAYEGAHFENFGSSANADIAYSSYKIAGNGSVSFVQNHPSDSSKVIVYAAPEGDEVAVYTRGSGRLVGGEARVALGETFALVANPDVGLTAIVTPTSELVPLMVVDKSTRELFVRGPAGSNASFDFAVWGLRIGFEEQSIVQPKQRESKIPSMAEHETFFAAEPALRDYTALARFKGIDASLFGRKAFDFSRADKLRDAVGVFAHKTVDQYGAEQVAANGPDWKPGVSSRTVGGTPLAATSATAPSPTAISTVLTSQVSASASLPNDRGTAPTATPLEFEVVEPIDSGDVLALDPLQPGKLRRAATPGDPNVAGIADRASAGVDGIEKVSVVTSTYATVSVDARFGAIHPGDLLVSSTTPGHAMLATAAPPGTVIGKALQSLESGTGVIRVLLLSR